MAIYIDPKTGKMSQNQDSGFVGMEEYNASQAPATPAEPTVGEAYSVVGESPEEKAAREAVGSSYKTAGDQVIDENAIREATTAKFQAEIDALNKIYAEKKRVEGIAGEGRLGETGAISARRGLLGSDFGAAQKDKTTSYNVAQQGVIDAEKSAKLSNIYSQIRSDVDAEVRAKTLAKQSGSENYLAFLRDTNTRKKQYVADTIKNVIANEVSPSEQDFVSIAEQLGTSVDDVKAQYKAQFDEQELAKQTAEALAQKTALETRGTEADIAYKEAQTRQFDIDNLAKTDKARAEFEQQAFDNNIALADLELDRAKYETDTDFRNANLELDVAKTQAEIDKIYNDIESAGTMTPLQQVQLEKAQGELAAKKATADQARIDSGKALDVLDDKIALIDKIIGDKAGIDSVVGPNIFSRNELLNPGNFFSGSAQNFVGNVKLLTDKETLDALIELKARGGTLGAISEKELAILQNSATKIAGWEIKDKNGVGTGKYDISEKKFKEELERIKGVSARLRYAAKEDKKNGVGVGNKTTFDSFDDFKTNASSIQIESADKVKDEFFEANGFELENQDLIDLINEQGGGSTSFNTVGSDTNQATLAKAENIEEGKDEGQCGRFVNKLTGIGVGDTFQSKMAKMDTNITEPKEGMVFTMPYKDTGHCGIVVGVDGDDVIVKDSNWSLDEKVQTHRINKDKISGYANV